MLPNDTWTTTPTWMAADIRITAETWGISGPSFLAVYLTAAAGLVGFSLWHRLAGRRSGAPPTHLIPPAPEVAYLTAGPRRALAASLGALRILDAVRAEGGRLTTTGPLPSGPSRLDHAVYEAAGRGVAAGRLTEDAQVASALTELRERLVTAGWLRDDESRTRARLGGWLLFALAAVGAVRIVAGLAGGKPIGFLALATLAAIFTGIVLVNVPLTTKEGRAVIVEAERRNQHLAPSQDPAWATYGIGAVAMSLAVYGAAPLWAADPAFAAETGIEEAQAEARNRASQSGDSGGGSGDGGGGGGCGGGGCGG